MVSGAARSRRARRGWCGLESALAADPDDRGVGEVGAKALLGAETPSQRLEGAERDLLLGAAPAADEMAVTLDVGAVPSRHAIVEVRVGDVAKVLEGLEVAVDGRRIDLGMPRADLTRDLLRGGVMTRALERVEHQAALHRHPPSFGADLIGHAHAATVRQSQAACKSRYCDNLR
jgi:hypothetical protein